MRITSIALSLILLLGTSLFSLCAHAEDVFSELNAAYGDTTLGQHRQGNWHGLVGVAAITLQRPMADTRTFVLPLVALSYRHTLFWHFGEAGVYFLSSDDHRARLAFVIKGRRGYNPADNPALAGMDKRYTSVEAGLHGIWRVAGSLISYGGYSDVSHRSDGSSAQLSLGHPFRIAPRWHLVPSVGLEWLSDKVVNYYYGVKPSEATATRPAYTGSASTNLRVGVMLNYRLSHGWSLFGGIGYTKLGHGISDSPIVTRNSIAALHIGGGWHF